jgi:hypothetical protein
MPESWDSAAREAPQRCKLLGNVSVLEWTKIWSWGPAATLSKNDCAGEASASSNLPNLQKFWMRCSYF